jgi:hypothetical protein
MQTVQSAVIIRKKWTSFKCRLMETMALMENDGERKQDAEKYPFDWN